MSLQKEYTLLFNTVTETIEQLESMTERLKEVQQKAEALCISACEQGPVREYGPEKKLISFVANERHEIV